MSYAIPGRGLPGRGWVDRSLPEGPSALVSTAEQWGAVPRRGIGIGEIPLYGIPSSEPGTPFVSDAEQIGAIPELGIPIGAAILRGIPVYGAVAGRVKTGGKQFRERFVVSQAKAQALHERILKDDNEVMEILAMVLQSGIL